MNVTGILLTVVGLYGGLAVAAGPVVRATVDFTRTNGTIRALNGGNIGPNLALGDLAGDGVEAYRKLKVPLTRLHDMPIANPNMRMVDIQHVFPNMKADAQNPDNYYFRETDDAIRVIRAAGSEALYRLGTSIEHSIASYAVHPPADFGKWADVCINIIRHYNEGWANGYKWNVRYWEIWNEYDGGKPCWGGSPEAFCRFYETVAKKLKARFPNLKIGGPAFAGFHPGGYEARGLQFLAHCRDHKVPLDFFSWHNYGSTIPALADEPLRMRRILDSHGYAETELFLDEWHYSPRAGFRREIYADTPDALAGINAAVFAPAVLTAWQDTPLTMGCHYTIGHMSIWWGAWGRWNEPYRLYYTLRMFAGMLDHPQRVAAGSDDAHHVQVLAGRAKDGSRAVLVSNFMSGADRIQLTLKGAENVVFRTITTDADDLARQGTMKVGPDGTLVLPGVPKGVSSAWYLFEPKEAAHGGFRAVKDEDGSGCAALAMTSPDVYAYAFAPLPVACSNGILRLSATFRAPRQWAGTPGKGTTLRAGLFCAENLLPRKNGTRRTSIGEFGPDLGNNSKLANCFCLHGAPDGRGTRGYHIASTREGWEYRYVFDFDLARQVYSGRVFERDPKAQGNGRELATVPEVPFWRRMTAETGAVTAVGIFGHGIRSLDGETFTAQNGGAIKDLSLVWKKPGETDFKTIWQPDLLKDWPFKIQDAVGSECDDNW